MTVSARAAHTPVAPSTYSAVQSFHNTRLSHQLANSFFNLLTAHNLSDTQPWQTSGACRSSRPCQPKSSALAAKNPQPKPAAAAKTSLTAQLSASKPTRPTHKILCGTFKDFAQHPSAGKCRVVAFLPGETKPRFMWATLVDEGSYMTFDAQSLFPTSERYESKITIHHNAWTDTGLGYELHVYFTTRATDFYPLPNQAVYTACGGLRPKFSYEFNFHGPIFAFCGRLGKFLRDPEYEHELVQAHDMDMRTYAHLVAYLTYYYNKGFASLKGPKVPCVKVACEGERKSGTPSHQTVRVPRTHPIFIGQGVSSKISERLVMPQLTWKCPTSPTALTNQHITFMHVNCDPNTNNVLSKHSSLFGFAPMLFQNDVGTQLVASTTKTPLSAEIVEAFGDFCQWHLTPYFEQYCQNAKTAEAPVGGIKQVLDQITNAKWTEYLSQWKAERKDAAASSARGTRTYTLAKASSGLERMGVTEDDSERLNSILRTSLESYLDLNKLRFGED